MTIQSGTFQSNCCANSIATVFWPSIRREFFELARYRFSRLQISWTNRMQPSKSVRIDSVSAPFVIGCISCASDIISFGRKVITGIPAAAP